MCPGTRHRNSEAMRTFIIDQLNAAQPAHNIITEEALSLVVLHTVPTEQRIDTESKMACRWTERSTSISSSEASTVERTKSV